MIPGTPLGVLRHFLSTVPLALASALLAAALHGQNLVVKPYVQPGDGAALGATDVKVIAWMTDRTPGAFTVEISQAGTPRRVVRPESTTIRISEEQHYLAYAAKLSGLPLNSAIGYRVKLGDQVVGESSFLTRKTPDQALRFVVVGDAAAGTPSQRAVAYHLAQARPEFVLLCGDIVYLQGRMSEYMTKFWPVYGNAARADPAEGAPLMQSVPFYGVLGNHDVVGRDLAKIPDACAAFYFFHSPRNAPAAGPWITPIAGAPEQVKQFMGAASAAGYPNLCLYSFDNGPAHFLVLDSNDYLPVNDPGLREWIRRDLAGTKARWKLVFFHHPGFHSSAKHQNEQRMRLFAPLFEECGVDVVFAGHVHNYQRSKPLHFAPNDPLPAKPGGPIRGTFKLDETFDGAQRTVADGIIYFVTGAGGAGLYPMMPAGSPTVMAADPDAPAPFIAKFVTDRRSFSLIELDARKFALRQIDENGKEIDRITVTKPNP